MSEAAGQAPASAGAAASAQSRSANLHALGAIALWATLASLISLYADSMPTPAA